MSTPLPFKRRRRRLLQAAIGGAVAALLPTSGSTSLPQGLITSAIPSSGQRIPVIGMGTSRTFNVGNDAEFIARRTEVLRAFFKHGGGMIDSSPMYGSSEMVLGRGLAQLGPQPGLFSATKVWTRDAGEGPEQISASHGLWGLERFDLNQVHNLVAWQQHLPLLYAMKARGALGYVGITTSHGRRHDELEQIMRTEPIDFVQLSYNIEDREAENRLLPLAREKGIAVIANRPFQRKDLINRYEKHPLPSWANEIGCENWPQFLLKFIVSHPAISCAIPATSRVDHMIENMAAGYGELPDQAMRRRMVSYLRDL